MAASLTVAVGSMYLMARLMSSSHLTSLSPPFRRSPRPSVATSVESARSANAAPYTAEIARRRDPRSAPEPTRETMKMATPTSTLFHLVATDSKGTLKAEMTSQTPTSVFTNRAAGEPSAMSPTTTVMTPSIHVLLNCHVRCGQTNAETKSQIPSMMLR